MSGFCGVVDFSGRACATREILGKMLAAIAHRGPDGGRLHVGADGSFGMGHQLHALSPAGEVREPVCEGDVWAVTDGYVTNYDALRSALEGRGHRFRSDLDAELVLKFYLEKGTGFAEEIDGTVCAAVYDARRRRLVLVRDRMGVKSLYYTEAGGCVVFGSEIRALMAHPSVRRVFEPSALLDFLYVRHRPAPLTMFKDVRKVRNAEAVVFDAPGRRAERQYWSPLAGEVMREKDEGFFVEEIRERFRESVKENMRTCRKVGVFLSGGLDSSSVVGVMSALSPEPIHTFSLSFRRDAGGPEEAHDEMKHARAVAEHFGTAHHEAFLYGRDYLAGLREVVDRMEDVSQASEQVMLLAAVKMARDAGVPVALTGEGGIDEYMGSGTYMLIFNALRGKWGKLRKLPLFLRKLLFLLAERLKFDRSDAECYSFRRAWLWLLANNRELFLMEGLVMNEVFLRGMLSEELRQTCRDASPYRFWETCYREIYEAVPKPDQMQKMSYCDWRTLVPDILNMECEKLGGAYGVDVRPAINPELARFLFRIPGEMKVAGGESKQLFKKAMDGIIPHEIAYRRKGGFSTVMEKFFHDNFAAFLREEMEGSALREAGLLHMPRIMEIIEMHESGRVDHTWLLLSLLMLFMWHRRWMET